MSVPKLYNYSWTKRIEYKMKICAIDIHHHYVPNSLLEEAKSHGKTLGVEFTDTDGQKALSFAGSPKFVLQRELSVVDERLKMMQD